MEPPNLAEKVEEISGKAHVVFGGCVPAKPRSFIERAMADGVRKEYRDRRDWNEIRGWAQQVAAERAPVRS